MIDPAPRPPATEAELLARAHALAGHTLGQLAQRMGQAGPGLSVRAKGYAGQLLELALGASAGSQSLPDFVGLGVELKSIPVDHEGKPRESTYVCTVPLLPGPEWRFEDSGVRRKLARVLWFPVLMVRGAPVAERRLGRALLWSPSEQDRERLRRDFEDHMELIALGRVGRITARHGEILQIRPKGANARERSPAIGPEGQRVMTNPRGFYLRSAFTRAILAGA